MFSGLSDFTDILGDPQSYPEIDHEFIKYAYKVFLLASDTDQQHFIDTVLEEALTHNVFDDRTVENLTRGPKQSDDPYLNAVMKVLGLHTTWCITPIYHNTAPIDRIHVFEANYGYRADYLWHPVPMKQFFAAADDIYTHYEIGLSLRDDKVRQKFGVTHQVSQPILTNYFDFEKKLPSQPWEWIHAATHTNSGLGVSTREEYLVAMHHTIFNDMTLFNSANAQRRMGMITSNTPCFSMMESIEQIEKIFDDMGTGYTAVDMPSAQQFFDAYINSLKVHMYNFGLHGVENYKETMLQSLLYPTSAQSLAVLTNNMCGKAAINALRETAAACAGITPLLNQMPPQSLVFDESTQQLNVCAEFLEGTSAEFHAFLVKNMDTAQQGAAAFYKACLAAESVR